MMIFYKNMNLHSEKQQIVFVVNSQTDKQQLVIIDKRVFKFEIGLLDDKMDKIYEIPSCIVNSSWSIREMKKFISDHDFNPQNISIKKPMTSNNLILNLDTNTLKFVQRFIHYDNLKQAAEIIEFSHFLQFEQLLDAVGIAVASLFWPTTQNQGNESNLKTIQNQNSNCIEDIIDALIQFETIIKLSQTIQKQQIYNKYLKKYISSNSNL